MTICSSDLYLRAHFLCELLPELQPELSGIPSDAGWGREWWLTAFLWFVLAKQHFLLCSTPNGLKHTVKLTPSLATQLLLLIAFIFLNYGTAKFYVLIQNSM